MAQRYGGKFSPSGTPPDPNRPASPAPLPNAYDGKRRTRSGLSSMLFAAPLIFLPVAFTSGPRDLVLALGAFAVMMLAAWLTREGILAQEAFDARTVARRPAFPRKAFGSALTGIGLGLGTMIWQPGLLYPIAIGLVGAALHLFAVGPDPMRDKGMAGVDTFQTDRVARAVDEAEKYLSGMKDAILRAGDRQLEGRVERFSTTARALFRSVESNPGDLTAARKFLSVYLMGARDATVKFADHYARSRDAKARADYEALLSDLETHFAERTQALLSDNRTDLDVEIEVLRERLQRET